MVGNPATDFGFQLLAVLPLGNCPSEILEEKALRGSFEATQRTDGAIEPRAMIALPFIYVNGETEHSERMAPFGNLVSPIAFMRVRENVHVTFEHS